ncbi:hypothetical protein [Promineifilum sp.]
MDDDITRLQEALAALEAQRAIVGHAVVFEPAVRELQGGQW